MKKLTDPSFHLSDELPLLTEAISLHKRSISKVVDLSLGKIHVLQVIVVHAATMSTQDDLAIVVDADIVLSRSSNCADGDVVLADDDSPVPVTITLSVQPEGEASANLLSRIDQTALFEPVKLWARLGPNVVATVHHIKSFRIMHRGNLRITTKDADSWRLSEVGYDTTIPIIQQGIYDLVQE